MKKRAFHRFERLESRRLLHGADVTVMDNFVVTDMDKVPRFAARAEFVAVKSGDWSNPLVWNQRRIPGAGAKVQIPAGIELDYDLASKTKLDAIEVSGRLDFETQVNTSLWISEIMVMPHGALTIGTELAPVAAGITAEIVFTDTPGSNGLHFKTGSVNRPGIDPNQYGNGLLVFGKLEIHGADKTVFTRSTGDIAAGDTTIDVTSSVSGWKSGDVILVPETSQTPVLKQAVELQETETAILAGVTGRQLTLGSALINDHDGMSSNGLGIERFAHVANITRNVVIRSENTEGVRGHILAMGDADVHVSQAELRSLGRTSAQKPVASTLYNSNASLAIIGTNQIGRYSIHFHHLTHAFMLDGIVVNDGLKWGAVVHGSNNGTIQNSVFYNIDGAAVVTEGGAETGNSFLDNLVIQVNGGHQKNDGRAGVAQLLDAQGNLFTEIGADGSGFWTRSSEGTFVGNAVYDAAGYGFNFNGYYRTPEKGVPWQYQQLDRFADNETVSSKGGLWFTWSQGQFQIEKYPRQLVSSFVGWNLSDAGVQTYHEANLTFQNITLVNSPDVSSQNEGSATQFAARVSIGINLDTATYENFNIRMDNIKISGFNIGVIMPVRAGVDGSRLNGAVFQNYMNIAMESAADVATAHYSNLKFIPSQVARVAPSMSEYVADIWHERIGVIKSGVLSSEMPTPLPLSLPVKFTMRRGKLLTLTSGEASDRVRITEVADSLHFLINDQPLAFRRSEINSLLFRGNGGDDTFENFSSIPAQAFGGEGKDRLVGGSNKDYLNGQGGNDELVGSAGDDLINGGDGDDLIDGGAGADRLSGYDGKDKIFGGLGMDVLSGGNGDDELWADEGDDLLVGGLGNDVLAGGSGDDILLGNEGNDRLYGNLGNDLSIGGLGDDWLYGDRQRDKMQGGGGKDKVIYDLVSGA